MKKYAPPAIAALLCPALALAQTDDNLELDQVVVESVYSVPAQLANIGSSVTLLDEADFTARGATTLTEILQTVPGLAIGATGGRGAQTSVFMRGADSDQTLVVVDGVKMNPASGSGVDFGGLSLANIERIEVLRGEQSALWGSDAVGGVIYITTKSGKNAGKPFNASIDVGVGSHATADVAANLYGRQAGLYYALNMANNRSHGFSALSEHRFRYQSQDGATISTGGATEADKYQRSQVGVRFGYEFERAGLELLAAHSTQSNHFDPAALAEESTTSPHSRLNANVVKLSGYVGDDEQLLKHSAYLSAVNSRMETFSAFSSNNKGKKGMAGYQLDINFDRQGQTQQALTGLLEHQKNTLNTQNFDDDKALSQKSFALEYRLFNDDDHAFSAGARYDDNSEFDSAWTYRLAGGYRINDNFRLHASYGTAVKNPTMYDYYGYMGTYQPNLDLKPEKSRGGDIGLLVESGDGNHRLDVTYFDRKVDDLITTNADFSQSINIDDTSTMRGVELSLDSQLSDALTTYANHTYTQAEDATDAPLARRPTHQANVGLSYRITPQLNANANMAYVGKRRNNYFDSATFQSSAVDLPDYTLVNVGANYQLNDGVNVYARINNLFDKQYENVIGYGQAERTFYLGVKADW